MSETKLIICGEYRFFPKDIKTKMNNYLIFGAVLLLVFVVINVILSFLTNDSAQEILNNHMVAVLVCGLTLSTRKVITSSSLVTLRFTNKCLEIQNFTFGTQNNFHAIPYTSIKQVKYNKDKNRLALMLYDTKLVLYTKDTSPEKIPDIIKEMLPE